MDIIYLINTREGPYIGKLAKKNFLEDHLDRSGLFKTKEGTSSPKDAWEASWIRDLKEKGLQSSDYIQGSEFWDEASVRSKIIQSFNNTLSQTKYKEIASGEEMFEWVTKMWGRTDTTSVTEALCILLASREYSVKNLKIDFLAHGAGLDIEKLFTEKEISRIQEAVRKKWMPEFFVTLNIKNVDFKKADEKLIKELENNGWKLKRGLLKHPEVVKALKNQSVDRMKNHIIKDLEKYKQDLNTKRNVQDEEIFDYLDKVIEKTRNSKATTRYKLLDAVDDMFKNNEWQERVARKYDFNSVNKSAAIILDLLTIWYHNTSIDSILGTLDITNSLDPHFVNYYKKQFTDYIQRIAFGATEAPDYQSWKQKYLVQGDKKQTTKEKKEALGTWLEQTDELYMAPARLYPHWLSLNNRKVINEPSLFEKTRDKFQDNAFIFSNWDQIYPQQVAIYLTKKGYQFNYTNMNSSRYGMKWYNTMAQEEITIY